MGSGIVAGVNAFLQAIAGGFSAVRGALPGQRRLAYVSWGSGGSRSWRRVSMGQAGERPVTLEISECSRETGWRELTRTYVVPASEMEAFARFVESFHLRQWASGASPAEAGEEAAALSLWYAPRLRPVTLVDSGALPPEVARTIDRIRAAMESHAKPGRIVEEDVR